MDISQARCPGCKQAMQIKQVRCPDCDVNLDGEFELSALAGLELDDQVFLTAFLRHHGSIKKMEKLFGISYPTVKNRLNALAAKLDHPFHAPTPEMRTLEMLERGEIDVKEALERLE
jgi:hypothetical protein